VKKEGLSEICGNEETEREEEKKKKRGNGLVRYLAVSNCAGKRFMC